MLTGHSEVATTSTFRRSWSTKARLFTDMKDPEIAAGMYHLSGNKSLSHFVYYPTHAPVYSADLRLGESSLSTNVKDAVGNLNKLPQRPDRSRLSLGQLSRLRNIMKSHALEKNPMRQLWKPSRRLMLARPYLLTIPSPEWTKRCDLTALRSHTNICAKSV